MAVDLQDQHVADGFQACLLRFCTQNLDVSTMGPHCKAVVKGDVTLAVL